VQTQYLAPGGANRVERCLLQDNTLSRHTPETMFQVKSYTHAAQKVCTSHLMITQQQTVILQTES
jgi:hypothetical protein